MLTIEKYGGDITASEGMQEEKQFLLHGSVSTFEHSVSVTKMFAGGILEPQSKG